MPSWMAPDGRPPDSSGCFCVVLDDFPTFSDCCGWPHMLWVAPDGIQQASGRRQTAPDGFGRL